MTAPVRSFPVHIQSHLSRDQHRTGHVERSCQKCATGSEEELLKALVVKALWAEFPGHDSEKSLADEARDYFRDRRGDPISPRTIRYWLRGETLPSALHLSALVVMQPKLFIGHWVGANAP